MFKILPILLLFHLVEFGESYPLAWINFYPNGGITQPMCQYGKSFTDSGGEEYEGKYLTFF